MAADGQQVRERQKEGGKRRALAVLHSGGSPVAHVSQSVVADCHSNDIPLLC